MDYSDLSKIEIATATTEDGQRKFMVMLDLENYRMKFYENGKCTDYTEYLSLADMIAAGISHSDFESFVLERAENIINFIVRKRPKKYQKIRID